MSNLVRMLHACVRPGSDADLNSRRTEFNRRLKCISISADRGSPIGFSGSGIWLISRPGFGSLKEEGGEIPNCNYDRDTGFGDFNRRESGNVASVKETEIREFQRLKYAKKIKLWS